MMKTIFEKIKEHGAANAAWGVVVVAFLGWGSGSYTPENANTYETYTGAAPSVTLQ